MMYRWPVRWLAIKVFHPAVDLTWTDSHQEPDHNHFAVLLGMLSLQIEEKHHSFLNGVFLK